jgi:hypothetical protein
MCATLTRRWHHRAETALFAANTDEKHDARKWNAILRFDCLTAFTRRHSVISHIVDSSGLHNLWCLDIAATTRERKQPSRSASGRLHRKAQPPFANSVLIISLYRCVCNRVPACFACKCRFAHRVTSSVFQHGERRHSTAFRGRTATCMQM